MRMMYDSVNPAAIPGRTAAAYVNGEFAWSRAEEARFGALVRISVMPGMPEAAKAARVLDVERYDATVADIGPFVKARSDLGHHDATIYMSLSALADLANSDPELVASVPRWWVAWWWGRPGFPRLDEVAGQLQDRVPADRIWACQYRNTAEWDESVIYGRQDFSR